MTTITPLALHDVLLITPKRHGDARGWFAETWSEKLMAQVSDDLVTRVTATGVDNYVRGFGRIETSLKGTFEFKVRKDLGWKLPRAETPTHLIAFGLNADLDDAAAMALRQTIDWIVALTGIPKDEAYALCSMACDLHVTQTVNNVKGVHAMIAKSILRRP